jgi:hypothetical protein
VSERRIVSWFSAGAGRQPSRGVLVVVRDGGTGDRVVSASRCATCRHWPPNPWHAPFALCQAGGGWRQENDECGVWEVRDDT